MFSYKLHAAPFAHENCQIICWSAVNKKLYACIIYVYASELLLLNRKIPKEKFTTQRENSNVVYCVTGYVIADIWITHETYI